MRTLSFDKLLSRFFWMHPEWWSLGLTATAWGLLIPHAIAHQGHMHHIMSFSAEFLYWCLMVVAMMVPLMMEPLRWVAFQSFRHRRHRAVLLFLIGFLVPWMMIGLTVAGLRTLDWVHNPFLVCGMFGVAAVWVFVPVRTRALVFCHRTVPLAPSGWNADLGCLRYGNSIGVSCVVTCGFLMLACTLTGHSLIAMIGGAVLGALERRAFRPPTRRIFVGALLLAVWFFIPIGYQSVQNHGEVSPLQTSPQSPLKHDHSDTMHHAEMDDHEMQGMSDMPEMHDH